VTSEEREITLGVLNAINDDANVTQRRVAKDLGIALGLTNSYLKRCLKKGLIKIQQAPANRYAYYLTPQGFSEKSRLTAEYLSQGFNFFRQTRNQCQDLFAICQRRGWNRIALHGLTDISEIAVLCSVDFNVEIVAIIDKCSALESYSGRSIVKDFADIDGIDAVLITDLDNPQAGYEKMIAILPPERVLTPAILDVVLKSENAGVSS
jgi:DNA-binding MarR family transcriptional regulator